jgi:hypothetical protein
LQRCSVVLQRIGTFHQRVKRMRLEEFRHAQVIRSRNRRTRPERAPPGDVTTMTSRDKDQMIGRQRNTWGHGTRLAAPPREWCIS